MKQTRNPIRLFIEILLIVSVAQAAVMLALPAIATGLTPRSQMFLSAALLILLAGPTIYWRCMAGPTQPSPSTSGKRLENGTVNSAIVMTAAAQVLGLALTGLCVIWQLRSISAAAQEKFERRAERIERDVRRHFSLPVYGLNGLRGLFAADGQVTRGQLRAWVESRDLHAEFPGVRGFGFIERVKRDDLASFLEAQRADGSPEFAVDTAGNAPDLYVVKYIEPSPSNRGALGKDVGREAIRREAAERAVRSGLPSLSGSIGLVQDDKRGPGFLYFVPIYKGGNSATLATPEQRESMVIGLVYAPIVVSEIMKGVTDVAEGTLDIELFDRETTQAGDLLYDSRRDASSKDALALRLPDHAYESLRRFVVGGRTLTLRATSTPAFEATINRSNVAFVALGGLGASFLMALAVWLLSVGRVRAQRRAQRMTADLARLARVVQHTSNSVAITDAQMRIHWVNEGFTRITGYSLEEASGRTPGELLGSGKADPPTIKTLLDAVAAGEACRVEVLNRAKDGREYWVDTEVQPTRDEAGVLIGFMEIGYDITERRALDEELRRSNELMTGVLQSLPCGLSVVDDQLKLVAHNGQFRELLELPDAVFEAQDVTFDRLVRISAERGDYGSGDVEDIVAGVIERARDPVVQFFERERANGLPLDVRRAPIPGGGFVTTYTDVSARKQAEILLKDALARAEQASVTKSQFLANMSHEIRTPMNAILGMLGLLQKTSLTPRQLDYASKTEGAARSLLGLLNDILDFSKAEAGKMSLDPRPFRVDRLLRDLSTILSANVGAKTIDVLFDIDPAVPRCLLGDDMRLQQVLINLGGNAIKFTSHGEVVLSLRVVERTEEDVLLEFAMRDSGIGIAPENQAHIFTGFSQAEASTTRRFGGTGLGLAICQRLVALMGGELRLDSTPGKGSTFHFQIRLILAEAAADKALSRQSELGAVRALIVDDNASAREVFVGMAQSLGWQADAAASGAEAIALAAARASEGLPYETVFIDWQMPGLDGWETSQRLLEMAKASEQAAPLLFMVTGHGRDALAQRGAEEQAILSAFLVKPVTASMLFDAVSDARVALAHPELLNRPTAQTNLQRLVGMRVLVVEDNLNNQQVAQELLTDEGAHVALAANGYLGIEAVAAANPPFDAVLMDLQMPVMDGYTATARIRQTLGLTSLPIIAMTANAMASDREACLAAGMNDHVGKPFDLSNLVATLLRQTGRAVAAVTSVEPKAGAVSTVLLEQAERRGIDLNAALGRMGGNSHAYLRTLQTFFKDLASLPDQLRSLSQQGRFDESKRLMHTFKGLAGTLGIRPLANLAAHAERTFGGAEARAQQDVVIEQLSTLVAATLQDITHVAEALHQSLQRVVPGIPAGADTGLAEPADLSGLRRSLDELTVLLRGADMRALEVFEQLQRTHGHMRHALQPLDEAMVSLDFDQALWQCQALNARLGK
ncbi:MAG: CHASE domain-containing protein [Burkholderiales bacterium]